MSCRRQIESIEFRQCTLENPSTALIASQHQHCEGGPKRLTISCTMPEFGKLADGIADNNTHLEHLELQLHFWLQGPTFESFVIALSKNQNLRHLSIEYLDMNDDGFAAICQAVYNHPCLTTLCLGFTEKFVDTFRKLTEERRTKRTEAVLELVQTNSNIIELVWPECQQDPDVMIQVEECLEMNKNRKKLE